MKNIIPRIVCLAAILSIVSCQKDEFAEGENLNLATVSSVNEIDTIGWKSAPQWLTASQETFSVHYVSIEDAAITADVADNGLVLLFKKSAKAVNTLPFEEGATMAELQTETENSASKYWYHQVAEGSLLISCDAYDKTGSPDAASAFKYFVLTPEKLKSLETDGYTTERLMNMSYIDVRSLLGDAE